MSCLCWFSWHKLLDNFFCYKTFIYLLLFFCSAVNNLFSCNFYVLTEKLSTAKCLGRVVINNFISFPVCQARQQKVLYETERQRGSVKIKDCVHIDTRRFCPYLIGVAKSAGSIPIRFSLAMCEYFNFLSLIHNIFVLTKTTSKSFW